MAAAPRVKGNDWSVLDAPGPGDSAPTLTVSIVVPAHRAGATLPFTLAALAEQTYPAALTEVVVIDDGRNDPDALTGPRPDNLRVVRTEDSWGRAHACRVGASVAQGDVLHWLDADMVPARDEVARQMRWHHAARDVVVVGHKLFVDATDLPPVTDVQAAVADDRLAELFADRWTREHDWVEAIWRRTRDLRTAGFRAFHVHVGATASVGRALYVDAGGMDPTLKLGEDIELGYRLAMKGAVFVAEREATSWHLGRSHLMRYQAQVQRFNAPHIAQRVPDFRKFRQPTGRSYRVPYVEAVVDVSGRSYEEVKHTVDGLLQGGPGDLQCLLVGPWSELDDDRRDLLADARLDLRLVQEEYVGDPRTSFVEKLEQTSFPAQFRLHVPVGWRPAPGTVEQVCREMQRTAHGLRSMLLPDGGVARMERTAAFERAVRVRRPDETIDDVVEVVAGTWWSDGIADGFEPYQETDLPTDAPGDVPDNDGQAVVPGVATPLAPATDVDHDPEPPAGTRRGLTGLVARARRP